MRSAGPRAKRGRIRRRGRSTAPRRARSVGHEGADVLPCGCRATRMEIAMSAGMTRRAAIRARCCTPTSGPARADRECSCARERRRRVTRADRAATRASSRARSRLPSTPDVEAARKPYQGQAGDFRLMSPGAFVDAVRRCQSGVAPAREVAWGGTSRCDRVPPRRPQPGAAPRTPRERLALEATRPSPTCRCGSQLPRNRAVGVSAFAGRVMLVLNVAGAVAASIGVGILIAVLSGGARGQRTDHRPLPRALHGPGAERPATRRPGVAAEAARRSAAAGRRHGRGRGPVGCHYA